ncbi:hypothetical protein DU53_04240 [Kosmotoga sp. DU53]|nr:hypothetical protein DU53_04240 [Kosmotoga sp. DU53]
MKNSTVNAHRLFPDYYLINSLKYLDKFFISPDALEVDFFKTSKTQEKSPSEPLIPPAFQKARNLKII